MNENGYSFVETILSVVIIMLLCGTLIPISYTMKTNLHHKKLEVFAAETAYEGVKISHYQGINEGTKMIEGVAYHWSFDGQQICVTFQNTKGNRTKCINANGEVL
ncbi:hypothetical protein AEA09_05575 [Lysinibacillus contaminans]|uniref:Type II secretion system protein n=1 Tax=Lysinibacillus contaminans TaxID=1293441 RepID=A0ABR5JZI9_9BACI|nr:hypothetical protein [Lysinibacillus contaminans]KOS68075.1 hypothetical protein AEA09_05575 [Lysinibacillus contaminans]